MRTPGDSTFRVDQSEERVGKTMYDEIADGNLWQHEKGTDSQ